MIEKALTGDKRYWGWIFSLLSIIGIGFIFYLRQLNYGLGITGMSRDVSWGLYIAQFTFLVGVAASAVMLVIPYYLHDYKKFGKIIILGEFLAIASVVMCLMFVFVDMGQPMRFMNVMLYPTPNSIMFWDMLVLNGYLLLNLIISWTTLSAEKNDMPPPDWVRPLIYISIPWAISIHTVTAFLYAGLPGRHLWLTAIMAPRFLSSAFASGPAFLIILCLIVKRVSNFDPGKDAIQTLGKIVTYAIIINLFFFILELFTAFYSKIPGHIHPFQYLFFGIEGHGKLIPWMWTAAISSVIAIILLVNPNLRGNENILMAAAILVFISTWIDKGMGLVIGGFIPNPFNEITEYSPTVPEVLITLGVWATGLLIITMLYKIAISIKEDSRFKIQDSSLAS